MDVSLVDSCVHYDNLFVTDLRRYRKPFFRPDAISTSSDHKRLCWLAGQSADLQAGHPTTFGKVKLIESSGRSGVTPSHLRGPSCPEVGGEENPERLLL
jgi:hypothetical protein